MKTYNYVILIILVFFLSAIPLHVFSEESKTYELYVDTKTKQVFTENAEGRERLQPSKNLDDNDALIENSELLPQPITRQESRKLKAERASDALVRSKIPSNPGSYKDKKWYDRIGLRGYIQFRYNETIDGDNNEVSHWPDRSVGDNTSFFIRRARLIFFGDISDHLYLYVQPDFASTPSGSSTTHFGQLRDAYGDIFFDKKKEFRVRVGQSKIPFSFENMQSSQLRLALDRNDALNSCCRDERDIGAFFYWTPTHIRERFRSLLSRNLKGSGDYGLFALGAYNGQGANRFEQNDQLHLISRFTYPYEFENGQIFEAGIQAYTGRFVPGIGANRDGINPDINSPESGFRDRRIGIHTVLYPQPIGFQAEWNWGEGPELNDFQTSINNASLQGGYIQAMYKLDTERYGTWFPFVKWQYYDGALKFERNAPKTSVQDIELGLEWQPTPELELVAIYTLMDRTNVRNAAYRQFEADIFRLQLQWNFF
jgi:phosphate-selective porin